MNTLKKKYFISIFWGYPEYFRNLAAGENYHLQIVNIAKSEGFSAKIITNSNIETIKSDPNFDPATEVIAYKNFFTFLGNVIKYSFQNSLFYVNSYEWQSFVVPFIACRTIFMAHTEPVRKNKRKQAIQNFVYKFFSAIRLNNEEEKQFLLNEGIPLKKLFVVPLVVSQDVYKLVNMDARKDLVYFGNVTAKKNVITILKAFEIVKKVHPAIKLNIVGNMLDANVEKYIKDSSVKESIVLHGFLPNEIVADKLNENLIYLNSSLDEGQCVAVYDAALCGCALCLPKIMSFTGVFGKSALFHDIFDYEKLAQNIIFYIDNPDQVLAHRTHNIDMIKGEYSVETVESKIKELIAKI